MIKFVLDCSVTMSWCFEDEVTEYSEKILEALKNVEVYVPELWSLEISNVLLIAERKKRLSEADSAHFIELIHALPIQIDKETSSRALASIISIGREFGLTSYDAAYLELAMRKGIPLATFDKNLNHACKKSGVEIFKP